MKPIVLFVSSGMLEPKKSYIATAKMNLYLNWALLGLATIVDRTGEYDCRMFQGDFDLPEKTINKISTQLDISSLECPIMLSLGSFYAVEWAAKFTEKIREINPHVTIYCGGASVLEDNLEWLHNKLPEITKFVEGYCEQVIVDIVRGENISHGNSRLPFSGEYNYSLLYEYKKYTPSKELARGCGAGCYFCYDRNIPLSNYCSPTDIVQSAKHMQQAYECGDITFYLESPTFLPYEAFAKNLAELRKSSKFRFKAQTRADCLDLKTVPYLAKAGLYQMDIGLESASPTQLLSMGKTKDPAVYLEYATNTIRTLWEHGIWVKLNIMWYPGETYSTIDETLEYLGKVKPYVKGLGVSPFILYRNRIDDEFIAYLEDLTPQDFTGLETKGYTYVNLSDEISKQDAVEMSKWLIGRYMKETDYLDMKKLSTFSREIK